MARRQGFRLVEVVNLLTEVTSMVSAAVRKAGGPPINQNQFFIDMQDLVKRYGTSSPEPVLANVADEPEPTAPEDQPDYNLAADLLAGAVLNQQVGKTKEAWNGFQAACSAVGINQILEAFETYNQQAMSDVGVDPTVIDNVMTENGTDAEGLDSPPTFDPPVDDSLEDEEDQMGQDDQLINVQEFMNKRASRLDSQVESVALANKISQRGDRRSVKLVKRNFVD